MLKSYLIIILTLLVWLMPGIIGHTPWKQDEAYSFGIIQHMLESGNWLVPVNAGQPFMEKPPLYYWTATLFASFFKQWLPLHDAARLASAFYAAISCVFVALFAKVSFRATTLLSKRVLLTVILYAGTPGMIKHAHDLFTDVALLTGTVIALYGLQKIAYASTDKIMDALWLSIGTVIALLSKGVFIPGLLLLTALTLPVLSPDCRRRQYWRQLCLAVLIALPLSVIWPITLMMHSQELFNEWFWQNNIGRFIGFSVPQLGAAANNIRIIEALAFFCFPSGVLALLYLLRGGWRHLRRSEIAIPLLFCGLGITLLQISSTSRHLYLLPFIAPLSILATRGLALLPRRFLQNWNLIVICIFNLLALLILAVWLATLSQQSMQWLSPLARWLPMNFSMPFKILPVTFAAILTAMWLLRSRWFQSCDLKVITAREWFLGMVLVWGLIFTLLLPWLDNAKGYQSVYNRMKIAIQSAWQTDDCMNSFNLGESEAPLLYYFTGILHRPLPLQQGIGECRWLLVESRGEKLTAPSGMALFWQGSRDGDEIERLTLFKKTDTPVNSTSRN